MPLTSAPAQRRRGIPEATVARLPVYHRVLSSLAERSVTVVSSEELATASGVTSAKLRKDLSHLGSYGTRGVGYDVDYLVYQIARVLGLTQDWPVVIVGVGNLGHALAGYGGFASRGFRVVGLLDADPARVGDPVAAGRGARDPRAGRPRGGRGRVRRDHRRHRHPGGGRPAGLRPARGRRCHEHPELRPDACSPHPRGSACARSTSRSSCRSSRSTSSASSALQRRRRHEDDAHADGDDLDRGPRAGRTPPTCGPGPPPAR